MELHREVLALAWALSAAGHTLHYNHAHQLLWWTTSRWGRAEVALELRTQRELVAGDWAWSEVAQWELRAWNDDVMIHATAPEGRLGAALEALGAMEVAR